MLELSIIVGILVFAFFALIIAFLITQKDAFIDFVNKDEDR